MNSAALRLVKPMPRLRRNIGATKLTKPYAPTATIAALNAAIDRASDPARAVAAVAERITAPTRAAIAANTIKNPGVKQ
jgi:hypothetical protein